MVNKRCSRCTEVKPLSEFNKNKTQKDGYENQCRVCRKLGYQENRDKKLTQKKDYRKRNSDTISVSKQEYYKLNGKKLNKARYQRNKDNPLYKIGHSLRSSIRRSLFTISESKSSRTTEILGCSIDELKLHLESQFEPWMEWGNYGNPEDGIYEPNKTWDIDHIIPISTAITPEDVLKLNNFNNLQPLCSYHNRFIKRDLF